MRIITYKCKEKAELGWHFSKVEFSRVNLLVGNTGTGKTRFLNTIFNLGRFVGAKEPRSANWELDFEHNKKNYFWNLIIEDDKNNSPYIVKEILKEKFDNGKEELIVEREKDKFIFKNENLPKLSKKESCISLLKEEEKIETIYDAFTKLMRRRLDVQSSNDVFS